MLYRKAIRMAVAGCFGLSLASCAALPKEKQAELEYVKQLCHEDSMVGDMKGVKLELDAKREKEKLKSLKASLTAERYRRLSQALQNYTAEVELLYRERQQKCRVWALCKARDPSPDGCQEERDAMDRPRQLIEQKSRKVAEVVVEAQVPPPAETIPSPLENRIFLYERYGGEWHTSNIQPIVFANNEAVLRKGFGEGREYRFTPTVYNGTKSVTLANPVQLYLNLPEEVTVKKPTLWIVAGSNDNSLTQYVATIPADIPPGAGNTLNESLQLTFPRPGRYQATYSIHGTTRRGEGFSTGRRIFYFELTE